MATPEDIMALRKKIADVDEPFNYTDEQLSTLLDETNNTQNSIAASLWRERAASAVLLVDVTESGSSRKLSQIRTSALEMADYYDGLEQTPEEAALVSRPRTRAITRP